MADDLAQKIRDARESAGFTQEQFAPMLGVALRTLTRYESGATERISVDTLIRIAKLSGKPLSFFVGQVAA